MHPDHRIFDTPWKYICLATVLKGALIIHVSDITNNLIDDQYDGFPFSSPLVQESTFSLIPLFLDDPIFVVSNLSPLIQLLH